MAREKPKPPPKLNKAQREAVMKTFTTEEIWNTKVPGDFIGDKIAYLTYLREEKKEKKEKEQKKKAKANGPKRLALSISGYKSNRS